MRSRFTLEQTRTSGKGWRLRREARVCERQRLHTYVEVELHFEAADAALGTEDGRVACEATRMAEREPARRPASRWVVAEDKAAVGQPSQRTVGWYHGSDGVKKRSSSAPCWISLLGCEA